MEIETLVPYGMSHTGDYRWPVRDVPEFAPMMGFFDVILTRRNGWSFEAIFIKNRVPDRAPPISVLLDRIKQIGRECSPYAHNNMMPVNIQLWELTKISNSAVSHLQDISERVDLGNRIGVSAWSLNTSTLDVWTNARLKGLFAGRKFVRKALANAVAGVVPIQRKQVQIGAPDRPPLLTYGLLAIIGIVFVLQLVLGECASQLTPTTASLFKLGGLNRRAVLVDDQGYRLFSSAFLHADIFHLLFNAVALYFSGIILEHLVGRAWLMTIFCLSLLGGNTASLVINGPEIVSVGASGAIMGMLAAAFVVSFRLPPDTGRSSIQVQLVYWLIPALIPILPGESGERVDFAAHVGGTVVGFAVGLFILKTWRSDERMPHFYKLALALGGTGAVFIYLSLSQAFVNRA